MCGINGILHLDGQPVQTDTLHTMNEAMIHRGPDDQGVWIDRHAGLGMRRLSIIDIEGARQPIHNEDGTIGIVCNGEIYNYSALRERLMADGHQFRTDGDVEVILHLYEQYGVDCVHHLRGMFAFVIWDSRTDTLFAARDMFGIKPLYYRKDQERFLCSSELKSLTAVCRSRTGMDMQSMIYYLTLQYVPDSRTMLDGVQKLPPAHYLVLRDKKLQIKRYWQPRFDAADTPPAKWSKPFMEHRVLEALYDSIRHHMVSDVPVGCFLSSGIDSTAVAALMQNVMQEPGQPHRQLHSQYYRQFRWRSDPRLHTFSVGFEGDHNECLISRRTAAELNTNHHEWVITEQEYFDMVNPCIRYQDDPVADPSAVALYGVSQLASEYVKVVMSGEGADELFGGYGIYKEPRALRAVQWLPQKLKGSIRSMVGRLPNFYGKNYLLRATTSIEERYVGNAKIFTDDVHEVLGQQVKEDLSAMNDAFQLTKPYYRQWKDTDDITRMQLIDMHFWLPGNILAKADKMSMAHSLELRVPYLDRKVFDAAKSIPAEYRVHKGITKYMLREALQGVVPEHVLHRPKLGFPVPLRKWLQGKRGAQCLETIRSSGLSQYLNMHYVEQLARKHHAGQADHARKIWNLYVLALWHEMFVGS